MNVAIVTGAASLIGSEAVEAFARKGVDVVRVDNDMRSCELDLTYEQSNRVGDHIWWIGDNGRFQSHYPEWELECRVHAILRDIHEVLSNRGIR